VHDKDEQKKKKLADISKSLGLLGTDISKEDGSIKHARKNIESLEQRIKAKPLNQITVEEIQAFDNEAKGIFNNVDGIWNDVKGSEIELKRILDELNALGCKLNEDRWNEAEKAF